ncbi:unnamed protein product [Macrosiphum euphorbiae]|uniref:Uncharacterized protein n=1 Tax=Macrosiphum euphorbiae TaxID=13131 RepID=A0AAV0XSV3_9HEMI|nr:unnamed protein product [Macrosiphum euphorbiae]
MWSSLCKDYEDTQFSPTRSSSCNRSQQCCTNRLPSNHRNNRIPHRHRPRCITMYPKIDCMFCGGEGILPPRHQLQSPSTALAAASATADRHYHVAGFVVSRFSSTRLTNTGGPDYTCPTFSDSDVPMWFEATKAEHCRGFIICS